MSDKGKIESLLEIEEVYYPSEDFKKSAWISSEDIYEEAERDYLKFWERVAEELYWFKRWEKVLDDSKKPFYKWFVGGKINASYNCLDINIKNGKKNKAAIIWESEQGDVRVLTYYQLYKEVCKFANVLRDLGVKEGDRVTIYMPMVPETVVAMLACARIGAVHSVVFAGFSAQALRNRIEDAEAKIVVTADYGYRRGKLIPLKENVDEALEGNKTVKNVIVYRRVGEKINFVEGRDLWWHELMENASDKCDAKELDSEHPLFILYTSGTTGKPKGVVHVHGGYMVGVYITSKWVFDLKDDDIYWCTADIGWITGHSYIVYGPLSNGATVFIYEGAPDYPKPDRFWEIIEKHGITIFYTAPTAIRMFMKYGEEWVKKHDLSSLRLLGSVGEPINPEAWRWFYKVIGNEKCPIVDTWWQTETGMIMITPLPGVTPLKPGSATKPFPGVFAEVFDEEGNPAKENEGGYLVITKPWPAMLRTLFKNPQRYIDTYWSKFKDVYFAGDGAKKDKDGYFWIIGRIDDVLNVSGHRIGTAELESALVSHEAVAEAAVVGKPHEIKGEAIVAFVILKSSYKPSEELKKELRNHVRKVIGPIATPEEIYFVKSLPKTRSGKIMRRVLRAILTGKEMGDLSTLEDLRAIEELKKKD